MRTSAFLDWFAISFGVALIALACGETEKEGSGSEPTSGTEDSAGGSSSSTTSFNAQDPVVAGPVTGVTTSPLTSDTTSSGAGGSGSTSMGGSGNSAGGASGSSAGGASGSSVGGASGSSAGGAAGAMGCGDCEPTTESFGDDDCQVWICFGSGAQQLVDAGCTDLATQVPRYCCPRNVSIECP